MEQKATCRFLTAHALFLYIPYNVVLSKVNIIIEIVVPIDLVQKFLLGIIEFLTVNIKVKLFHNKTLKHTDTERQNLREFLSFFTLFIVLFSEISSTSLPQ
jgi:hypothetical protein